MGLASVLTGSAQAPAPAPGDAIAQLKSKVAQATRMLAAEGIIGSSGHVSVRVPGTDKVLIGGLGPVPEDTGVDVGKGQLAPRLGIAYRLTEKTVIRAGYGISVDPNSFRNLRDAYPATISLQVSGASSFQAAMLACCTARLIAHP